MGQKKYTEEEAIIFYIPKLDRYIDLPRALWESKGIGMENNIYKFFALLYYTLLVLRIKSNCNQMLKYHFALHCKKCKQIQA